MEGEKEMRTAKICTSLNIHERRRENKSSPRAPQYISSTQLAQRRVLERIA
jgi:hypothetical protein